MPRLSQRQFVGLPLAVGLLALLVGAAIGWSTTTTPASADDGFNGEYWNHCSNGCIGWKQFAASTPSAIPIAHMDNGGSGCGGSYDLAWAYAIIYWNGAGTVASFSFARSDCVGVNYPDVRVVPQLSYQPFSFWLAAVYNYDQDPSTGAFSTPYCLVYCSLGENANIGAQYGYDLSYVTFNTAKSPGSWETVARHEIGHVVGMKDHHLDPYGCNDAYCGLMDDAGCDTTQLTAVEKTGVDHVNGH